MGVNNKIRCQATHMVIYSTMRIIPDYTCFISRSDEEPPNKQQKPLPLQEQTFSPDELLNFREDMAEASAEVATYLYESLDAMTKMKLEEDKE